MILSFIEKLYFRSTNNLALYCQLTYVFNSNWLHVIATKKLLKEELYVSMLDLDCLKQINDWKGHMEGDQVIKFLASELKQHFNNKGDYICRYGGDEFLLFSKDNPNRILDSFQSKFCYGTVLKLSNEPLFSAIAAADSKMYTMKKRKSVKGL